LLALRAKVKRIHSVASVLHDAGCSIKMCWMTAGWLQKRDLAWLLPRLGFPLLAAISIGPLLFEPDPVEFVSFSFPALSLVMKAVAAILLAMPVALRIWADRKQEPRALLRGFLFVILAGGMTLIHAYLVDWKPRHIIQVENDTAAQPAVFYAVDWQRHVYMATFHNWPDTAPHIYRPLPCGFVRTLERMTGDWYFACLAYRWFFDFWLLWAFYRFVRLFHGPGRSLLAVGIFLVLYPLSIQFYWGQLTDPMSHFLFVLALVYIVGNCWVKLLAAVFLGVLAKETAVVLAPAYWAVNHDHARWERMAGRTAALLALCAVAYLAARLPLGWLPGAGPIHSSTGLMIRSNLGIGYREFESSVPIYQNYLQPFLFVGLFLPFISINWRKTDGRLKAMFVTLTPLIVGTSLCFSWLYESRNYVPLLPVLSTMALGPTLQRTNGRSQTNKQ
jgi:hypothetical protein